MAFTERQVAKMTSATASQPRDSMVPSLAQVAVYKRQGYTRIADAIQLAAERINGAAL